MGKSWNEMKGDVIQWIKDNPHISEIEKGPAIELVRLHFQIMNQTIGNLELVRRRTEQKDLVKNDGQG